MTAQCFVDRQNALSLDHYRRGRLNVQRAQQIADQIGTIGGPYAQRIACFELHSSRLQLEGIVAGFFFRPGLIQTFLEQNTRCHRMVPVISALLRAWGSRSGCGHGSG
ncbi:hypothetical protein D3C74_362630 [compost metagenome]